MPLPLFDEPAPVIPRIAHDGPEAKIYWRYVREGREGQSFTFRDEDPILTGYARDGYKLGCLLRPLPCVQK